MKKIVMSLGGSLIVPDKINADFLKKFRKLIVSLVKKKNQIGIVCGGGKICRNYISAANKTKKIKGIDADWIGIMASRFNAELVRAIFSDLAYEKVIYNPTERFETKKKVLIAAGWLPGCSTDKDAVLLAKNLGADSLINLTNIDYVYDKDPRKFKSAKPIREIRWKNFRRIIGNKWKSGLNLPFDPVASRLAQKLELKVIILRGSNLTNLKNCLEGKKFRGTVIN